MSRIVFVSPPRPSGQLTEILTHLAYAAAVVGAGVAGWNSGGPLWAILYAFVIFITFPFLLTASAVLFIAVSPALAWPGTFLANQLGWTPLSPHAVKRMWLQRISVILLMIPILILLGRNALGLLGFIVGVATFGFVMVGLLILLPVILLTGLFLYSLSRSHISGGSSSSTDWTRIVPPKLPPPE
jgi:hypothetical protein